MQVVIDTNIVISAARVSQGNPAKILKLIRDNEDIKLYYNAIIFAEYKNDFKCDTGSRNSNQPY